MIDFGWLPEPVIGLVVASAAALVVVIVAAVSVAVYEQRSAARSRPRRRHAAVGRRAGEAGPRIVDHARRLALVETLVYDPQVWEGIAADRPAGSPRSPGR